MTDRTGCDARQHGDSNAYMNYRCRCDDAKNAQRLYTKKRKLARARGLVGRHDLVPTFRVVRRFQALARMGYSAREIQEAAWGYKRSNGTAAWMNRAAMGGQRFAQLDEVYQRLQATPGDNWRAKAHAVRRGWAAPLDWDNIDNPDEVPHNKTPEGRRQQELEWRRQCERQRTVENRRKREAMA